MSTSLPADFTHLRVHSHFSLLQATCPVEDLVSRAAAQGLEAIALTDFNALYGAVKFTKECAKAGIHPILGMTVFLSPPFGEAPTPRSKSGQLVLLAMGTVGYRSLCILSSLILGDPQREASYGKLLTWEELEAHSEGIICVEGGRGGWLEGYLHAGDHAMADRYIASLKSVYVDCYYLSLEIHKPEDQAVAKEIVALGQRFGVPALSIQPIYSLAPEDRNILQLLAAIRHNCAIDQLPSAVLPAGGDPGVELHWLDPGELVDRFSLFPQAVAHVGEVVRRCEPALPDGRPIWPDLNLPDGKSPDDVLKSQALDGLFEKYGSEAAADVRERLQLELDSIIQRGYTPLFLVVADIARFARGTEIPINTRGSVANSLVAYCIGITDIDPIAHDLLFERFLNPARADLPDIDLDFCSRRRDLVLDYVRSKYGEERVALVATVSTMRPKSAIRETSKVYGFSETEIKQLTARLPRGWHPDPRRREKRTVEDLLEELEDERTREVVRAGYRIVGQPHHLSVHPGGVVVTPGPLTDVVPVQWAPKGFLITQFDHDDVEAIGLPKIDLLGIRALTVLADATDLVRLYHDPDFRLTDIPQDDQKTGEVLSRGETIGVFQCESQGAQRTLRQLRARTVKDLAVSNAFFKPGPATGGMAQAFVRRYRGEEKVTFLHPALEPILGSTKGVLIFQEQILRVAREIAGLNWEEANHLRRGMSKFRAKEMDAMQAKFVAGCQRSPPNGPGFNSQQAGKLWEQVAAFAGYGFNKGHATSYANVSYRSAYLKAHWPAEFFCARLADRGGYHHPAIYMAEAVKLGIEVRPPHINHSANKFALSYTENDQGISTPVLWMGLGQVRDLRRKSVLDIVSERTKAPYTSTRDLMGRVRLQAKEVTHLIQCGALDGLANSRTVSLVDAENVAAAGSAYQQAFTFVEGKIPSEAPAQRMEWERRILGLPVSVNPLSVVTDDLEHVTSLRKLPEIPNRVVAVAGNRLPGWTGGSGFFLSDGTTFINVIMDKAILARRPKPPIWQPLLLRGRWRIDEWGGGWFQVEDIEELG
jgi:DNA polymerase-3 subunit alpha